MADNNPNPRSTQSQREQIKWWFLRNAGKEITSLDALHRFGCMEFPKRISELVADGMAIRRDKFITLPNDKRVKAYYITQEEARQYIAFHKLELR